VSIIAELVDRSARRFSDRTAVVDGDRSLTFKEVGERSTRLGNALQGLSPHAGSRVAMLLSNRLEFVECDFAVSKANKIKAPMNPRLSDEERTYILANCGADILITERAEMERVESIRGDLPDLKHIVSVDGGGVDYQNLLAASRPDRASGQPDFDNPSMILHTSGTTGHPKGATTSVRSRIAAMHNMIVDEFRPSTGDGMIHVAPMSHGSGSKILCYFVMGARNVTLSKFDPASFFSAIETMGGTGTFVVPTMIRMLLDYPDRHKADISRLRNITYGGSPMPPALVEEALESFGPVLTQVYGSCEAPHPVSVLSRQEHLSENPEVLSSAGYPTIETEVRIADPEGRVLGTNQPGELQVRGPILMTGYWGDDPATQSVFMDGWYRSGDVAQCNENGLISIVGREREMLISGGLNVYPAEVETVLHRHPAVSEAAVFGMPHDLWGEEVTAVVVCRQGRSITSEDLVQFCTERMADYKKPRRVVFVQMLPKGNTGKVSKRDLQEVVESLDET
jgi:acyl-CoA synthetase (AMP-forming)/AMP-acid ligase II